MSSDMLFLLVATISMAFLFDFANGWNDSANAIATVISTRVLPPLAAVCLAAVLNFVGGCFLGEAVAKTIGKDLLVKDAITLVAVLSAMTSAFLWTAVMTKIGMPISASHSLIGGLAGAGAASSLGWGALKWEGFKKVLVALFLSPLAGFVLGIALMIALLWIIRNTSYGRVNRVFGKLQLLSVSFMSLSHGGNDAQKVMGIITMALVAAGVQDSMSIPLWARLGCCTAIAIGTAAGGWKVIRTLGMNLTDLKPVHGFAAETAASAVLLATAQLGVPVSTTHTITGSILGVGAAKRLSAVRWGLGAKIILAWFVTLPACFAMAYAFALLSERIL